MYYEFQWTKAAYRRNLITQEYEPIQPFLLYALADHAQCGRFLDIGANIGVYSFFLSRLPSITAIHAYEANPETAREMRRNVEANALTDRIVIHQEALSDAIGETAFAVIGELSGANGILKTTIHGASKIARQVTVETTTLDHVFDTPCDEPVCNKIDVEGHENEVLQGGDAFLRANRALVQMEAYDDAGSAAAQSLVAKGYEKIASIGSDHYFTNIAELQSADVTVAAFQRASEFAVKSNHARAAGMVDGTLPLRLSMGNNAALIFSGRKAKRVRKLRKLLGMKTK